jgi:hypothetical protein
MAFGQSTDGDGIVDGGDTSSGVQPGDPVSLLNNDAGYVTAATIMVGLDEVLGESDNAAGLNMTNVNFLDAVYLTNDAPVEVHTLGVSGLDIMHYSGVTGLLATLNPQAFLTSGSNVSTLVNDSGYLTSYTETDPIWVSASNDFARLANFNTFTSSNQFGGHLIPSLSNSFGLGTADNTWSNLFVDVITINGVETDGTTTDISISNVLFNGDFIPTVSNAFDVGSPTFPVADLRAATATVYQLQAYEHASEIVLVTNTVFDFDDAGKTYIATNFNANVKFILPTNTAVATIGAEFTFINLSTNLLIIDSVEDQFIDDSDLGGQVYSGVDQTNLYPYSSITLRQADTNWWHITKARGDWTTTGTASTYDVPPKVQAYGGQSIVTGLITTVSFGTTFPVAMYPTVTVGGNATVNYATEITSISRSNFNFRIRNTAGTVVSTAVGVYWNIAPGL